MAARPHGADEPREGPIDEPFDEGGPERASGRSAHREEPHATGPSGPAGDDGATGDGVSPEPGFPSSDEATGEGAAAEGDDPVSPDPTSTGSALADPAGQDGGSADSADSAGAGTPRAGRADGAADAPPRGTAGPGGQPRDEAEDVDARWQEIIAQLADLDSEAPGAGRAGPDHDREAEPGAGPVRTPTTDPTAARTVRPAAPASSHRSWSPDPAVEEAEDHFEPPDPGPVLGGDPLLTMAWAVVVGVPVLFIAAVVLWRDIPTVVLRSAAVAFVAGVGLLLWRMPHRRDEDDGPGAVV